LDQHGDDARVLAGGQTLMATLNMRLSEPGLLVDLRDVGGLRGISLQRDHVRIGALTRHSEIEDSALITRHAPLLAQAAPHVAHRAIRNRGTIGGSLCHLDPSAELPLVAVAMDATIVVCSLDAVRTLQMVDFAEDLMTPAIESDEIVSEIRFKPWPKGHGWAFEEYARRKGDFAIVSAAAMLSLQSDGRIGRATLALGGVGPVPLRVRAAEEELVGGMPGPDLFSRAAAHCADIEPLDDPFAPGWYRRKLSESMARRVLARACARSKGAGN